jgi:hypothetical protein
MHPASRPDSALYRRAERSGAGCSTKRRVKKRGYNALEDALRQSQYLKEFINGRPTFPDHCGVPDLLWQPPVKRND